MEEVIKSGSKWKLDEENDEGFERERRRGIVESR